MKQICTVPSFWKLWFLHCFLSPIELTLKKLKHEAVNAFPFLPRVSKITRVKHHMLDEAEQEKHIVWNMRERRWLKRCWSDMAISIPSLLLVWTDSHFSLSSKQMDSKLKKVNNKMHLDDPHTTKQSSLPLFSQRTLGTYAINFPNITSILWNNAEAMGNRLLKPSPTDCLCDVWTAARLALL